MKINNDIVNNSVVAENQVCEKFIVHYGKTDSLKVLFLGNSITLHEKAPQIGWNNNWGMAASKEENDYVHIVLTYLRKKYGDVSYCICNVGNWEQNFSSENVLEQYEQARLFSADIVISRLGENVNLELLKDNDFEKYYEQFLKFFSEKASKIVVTNLFWEHESLNFMITNICKKNDYSFVPISDLGYDDTNKAIGQYEHQGVCLHPNDKEMKLIAERICGKIL